MLGKKKRLIKSEQINSVNSIKPLRHSKTDNCGYIITVSFVWNRQAKYKKHGFLDVMGLLKHKT